MSQLFKNLFILIVFVNFCTSNNNIYRIPFGLYNTKGKNNNLDIIKNIYYNIIYVNLSVGTPSQIVPFGLNMNSQTFTIYNKIYNKNLSSSYEDLSKIEKTYENEDVSSGLNSMDVLNLNNQKYKINFILSSKLKFKNYPFGILGLLIPNKIESGVFPFFNTLKKGKIINSYTWTLKYYNNISLLDTIFGNEINNNIIGEFIFGNEPHYYEEDKYRYNKSQLIKINPLSSYDFSWDIQFNNIYILFYHNQNYNKININLDGKTKLIPELGFIFVPKEFNYVLKKNFFEKYIEENVCRIKTFNNNYYEFIECDLNNKFKISSFPDICFEHKGLETTFNLTYKDLFIYDKNNNKYIFLMMNDKFISGWVFGSIFLRKYQFIFNQDSKTIGYYKSMNFYNKQIIKEKNEIKNNYVIIKFIFIIILIIISSFLLLLIGMYIQNTFFKKKKIKANELEENFSYQTKENKLKNQILLYENNIGNDSAININKDSLKNFEKYNNV